MKILFITDPGIVGGATRSLVDVVTSLKNIGYTPIVCTSTYSALNVELEQYGIDSIVSGHYAAMEIHANKRWKDPLRYVKYPMLYYLNRNKAVRSVEKQISMSTIDVIHTNSARNDLGAMLYHKYRIPHVMHIREFGKDDFNCWCFRRKYEHYLNENTTNFIAISRAVADSWISKGIDPSKVKVIYNGVDESDIVSVDDDSYFEQRLKLVMVGGVCFPKGQIEAVKAIDSLPDEIKDNIYLDIIGWGDDQYINEIKRYIIDHNLSDHINLLGASSEVHKILHNYHVGLMCSKAEGFGRVTAEYMHAGLGVIASDTGANPELIQDYENGLLYHKGDVSDLASKIIFYYKNRNSLFEYAHKGKEFARSHFTKKINAKNIVNLYDIITR